jgi:hypothetical protein
MDGMTYFLDGFDVSHYELKQIESKRHSFRPLRSQATVPKPAKTSLLR